MEVKNNLDKHLLQEKIFNLIRSKLFADISIGVELLLALPAEDIIDFFKNKGEWSEINGERWEIVTSSHKKFIASELFYADLGDWLFIHWGRFIRIRPKETKGIAAHIRIIKQQDYLNGLY